MSPTYTYSREGNDILATEEGKPSFKVATIDESGNLRMAHGMAADHKEAVQAFLKDSGEEEEPENPEEPFPGYIVHNLASEARAKAFAAELGGEVTGSSVRYTFAPDATEEEKKDFRIRADKWIAAHIDDDEAEDELAPAVTPSPSDVTPIGPSTPKVLGTAPPCPPEDPEHGDKTPEVMAWYRDHAPSEFVERYGGRGGEYLKQIRKGARPDQVQLETE